MSNKLFVGGLAWATDDASLGDAFAAHGEVREAKVILDSVAASLTRSFRDVRIEVAGHTDSTWPNETIRRSAGAARKRQTSSPSDARRQYA